MQNQETIQSDWNSEGFQANEYLKREEESCLQWDVRASRLTSALVKEPSGWGVAKSAPEVKKERRASVPAQLTFNFGVDEKLFNSLVEQWRKETRHVSTLSRMAMHPAYQRIIGFGREAVPLILRELQQRGGHWLWALNAITGEDPAPDDATFDVAKEAWLTWGRQRRHLT